MQVRHPGDGVPRLLVLGGEHGARLAGEVVETAAGLVARNVRVSELQFVADEGLLARINEGRPTLRRRGPRTMSRFRYAE